MSLTMDNKCSRWKYITVVTTTTTTLDELYYYGAECVLSCYVSVVSICNTQQFVVIDKIALLYINCDNLIPKASKLYIIIQTLLPLSRNLLIRQLPKILTFISQINVDKQCNSPMFLKYFFSPSKKLKFIKNFVQGMNMTFQKKNQIYIHH
eukprot:NP_491326.1 Uncharacterized protein CELE_C18E3.4 [Caenorhabditis elegans]